mmetsp:Transcript_53808/g.114894  ORF Transcript_53808/g.114894 Transcript_53808/m.114894 type:complete len:522 (+) Transcript_53808:76-1641(+)
MSHSHDGTEDSADQGFHAVVIKEHVSTEDLQLTLRVGDIVVVVEDDASGWAGGHKIGEESKSGWFPRTNIRPLTPQEELQMNGASPTPQSNASASGRDGLRWPMEGSSISPGGKKQSCGSSKADSLLRQNRGVATPNGMQTRELERELGRLRDELTSVSEELVSEKTSRQHAEQELRQVRAQLDQNSKVRAQLEQQLREVHAQAEQNLHARAQAERELREIRSQSASQDSLRKELEMLKATQRQNEEKYREREEQNRKAVQDLRSEVSRLRTENTSIRTSQEKIVQDYNSKKAQLAQVQEKLSETSAALSEKSTALDELRSSQSGSRVGSVDLRLGGTPSLRDEEERTSIVEVQQRNALPSPPARQPTITYSSSSPALPANEASLSTIAASPYPIRNVSEDLKMRDAVGVGAGVVLFGSSSSRSARDGPSSQEPDEKPRPGSVRAQIRALEKRCSSQHRQSSRGPCPGRSEGRRSGPPQPQPQPSTPGFRSPNLGPSRELLEGATPPLSRSSAPLPPHPNW